MQKISSNNSLILGSKQFHLWQWSFDIVLFSENNVYLAIKNQIFNGLSMPLSVRKMSRRIVQRLLQTNAKTSCLNP